MRQISITIRSKCISSDQGNILIMNFSLKYRTTLGVLVSSRPIDYFTILKKVQ